MPAPGRSCNDVGGGFVERGGCVFRVEEVAADQGLGGHRAAGAVAGAIAGQSAARPVEQLCRKRTIFARVERGNRNAAQLGTFEGHELPAELAHVAGVVGLAGRRSASRRRGAGRRSCIRRARCRPGSSRSSPVRAIGFAEGERGHAVAIHGGEQLGVAGQVAVGGLAGEQEFQAVLHDLAVLAVQVRFAGAEEARAEAERR